MGIKKGDRVALLVSNCLWAYELLLGIWRSGAVAVPLSPMLTANDVSVMLNDYSELAEKSAEQSYVTLVSEGIAFSQWMENRPITAKHIDLSADDLAVIIYSSGTTGTPKGIAHSHGSRLNFAQAFATQFRFAPHSRVVSCIPLHSNAGCPLSW